MGDLEDALAGSMFVLLVGWNPETNRSQIMVNDQIRPLLAIEEWREVLIEGVITHLRTMSKPQDDWPSHVRRIKVEDDE